MANIVCRNVMPSKYVFICMNFSKEYLQAKFRENAVVMKEKYVAATVCDIAQSVNVILLSSSGNARGYS